MTKPRARSSARAPPAPDTTKVTVVETKNLEALQGQRKRVKRRNFWIFVLGGIFGVLAALFFADKQQIIDIGSLADLNLDALIDVLPASLVADVQNYQNRERESVAYDSFAVGLHARSLGIEAHHPVIMVPGVISTGLESWGTSENSRQYFRKRLWGSWTMMRALVLDQAGWKRHIMLDHETGLDPPGVKLRAAQGFDATDFFITGYWIWNKILENLATIGYDPTNAFTAAYDWRLAYENLEKRDQYFTRLKAHIETAYHVSDRKVTLLSHSMGSQVLYYFLHWVESTGAGHGNGGPNWVEKHVDSWINVSGCLLGAIKDVPTVISGEMRDTVQLNAFAMYGLEKFLSRSERAEIFRAMPGLASMLPIGGEAIWGNATWAPDDPPNANISYGSFLNFRPEVNANTSVASVDTTRNLTVAEALPYLYDRLATGAPWYQERVERSYSRGVALSRKAVEANQAVESKWVNPLETRLPLAPSLKIYCFYGVGKPTERAYWYKSDLTDPASLTNLTIDSAFSDPALQVDHGVAMGEGDGTVSLISTGYMCQRGWRLRRYNPAGVRVTTYEMPHEPEPFNPRGGPNTADHVDILGRQSLNDLILRVAGGKGDEIQETIRSNIRQYADRVPIHEHPDDL